MDNKKQIFLPGTDKQLNIFLQKVDVEAKAVLVIGSGCEEIAHRIKDSGAASVIMIVNDHESLLKARFLLPASGGISVRMMDYDNTDFKDEKFDVIYAQASISNAQRNKIVKEIKRILKSGGFFCVGENINLSDSPPKFINDLWENSKISALYVGILTEYYTAKNFELVYEHDLSASLNEFYKMSSVLLRNEAMKLSDEEKIYYKKLLKKISHESNVYLKLRGDKYIGYKILILKKS